MVHKSKVIHGVTSYIDAEIVSKLHGSWKAWAIGGLTGIVMSRADGLMSTLAQHPIAKALNIVDGENIDVDLLYEELKKQAQKGSITVDVPLIGPVTFGESDVDNLRRHIMEA